MYAAPRGRLQEEPGSTHSDSSSNKKQIGGMAPPKIWRMLRPQHQEVLAIIQ